MRYLFFDLDGTLTNPAAGVIASLQAGASAVVERVEALRAAVQRFPAPSV